MQKDIREEIKKYQEENIELSVNHSQKFEALLQQELHPQKKKKSNYKWLSIAASIVLLLTVAIQFYPTNNIEPKDQDTKTSSVQKEISLGSISSEFKTIETYYINSIDLVISDLNKIQDNDEIIKNYLLKIKELKSEYQSLTKELNTKGVNDNTIDALIRNLQLRLQLLQRLKKQLKQLKNLNKKQDETQII